jgi:hypothetical protein
MLNHYWGSNGTNCYYYYYYYYSYYWLQLRLLTAIYYWLYFCCLLLFTQKGQTLHSAVGGQLQGRFWNFHHFTLLLLFICDFVLWITVFIFLLISIVFRSTVNRMLDYYQETTPRIISRKYGNNGVCDVELVACRLLWVGQRFTRCE